MKRLLTHRNLVGLTSFFLLISSFWGAAPFGMRLPSNLESEIDHRAKKIAEKLRDAGIDEVAVRIEGSFEDALRNKALSSIITAFANQAVKIQKNKAEHYLVATIEEQAPKSDREPGPSFSVKFALKDRNQKVVKPSFDEEVIQQNDPVSMISELAVPAEAPNGDVLDVSILQGTLCGYLKPDTQDIKLQPLPPPDPDKPLDPNQAFQSPSRPTLGLKPQQDIRDNAAFARKNGLFGVQILSNGRPVRHFVYDDGLAMVEFKDEKKYEVQFRNNSDFDVLFSLQIDGVDSGWFTKDKKVLWFCPKKSSTTIPGWLQAGDSKYGTFSIVDEADSVARQNGLSMQVGTIQVSVFKAFNNKDEIKLDPSEPNAGARGIGTGIGELFPAKVVRVAKVPGSLRSSVVVRYDRTGK